MWRSHKFIEVAHRILTNHSKTRVFQIHLLQNLVINRVTRKQRLEMRSRHGE